MSYTAQLPLNKATNSTYVNIDEVHDFVKQAVKNLLLTSPGEHIMLPNFGVGLRRHLFENPSNTTAEEEIQSNIAYQFEQYLPTVELLGVQTSQQDNFLLVKVYYSLQEFNVQDFLELKLEN